MNPKIKSAGQLAKEATVELKKFQTKEKRILKTGIPLIDIHVSGMLPGDLLLAGGASGTGKTFYLMRLIRNILDKNINLNADKFVTLEFMLEMKFLNLMLRDLNKKIKKDKAAILNDEFTEEEKAAFNEYYVSLKDGRRFIVDETVDSSEFFSMLDEFCSANKDKEAIIVAVDHLLLITESSKGEDVSKKVAEYTNIIKKKYNNVYFIYLSQLNRESYANVKDRSNLAIPTVANIYGSSHFEFLASFIIIMQNAFKLGMLEYMKVKKDRYPHLSHHMTSTDKKGFGSFNTLGVMFYHLLKARETDNPLYNLEIEKMDYLSEDQLNKMRQEKEEENAKIEIEEISFAKEVEIKQMSFDDLKGVNSPFD